jgi:GNAT domain-containint protein/N-acyltransferase family protein
LSPDRDEADHLLRRLGLDETDRAEVLDTRLSPDRDAGNSLWPLLQSAIEQLRQGVGQIDQAPAPWPAVPTDLGAQSRCFWVYAFLETVGDIRRWHADRGIPDDISWATLADLGRHMHLYRRRTGCVGLDTHWWIALHFRGALYQLGRLQFNPYRLLTGPAGPLFWYDAERGSALGEGFRAGDRVVGVHIPEAGPLDAAACDESFKQAAEFFPRYLPEYASHVATCTSWLLDDQLLEYLPEDSNIVQFQRRFELVPGTRDSDSSAFHFVFGRSPDDLRDLQPQTTLERAIVEHVARGRHWRLRTGWLRL